MIVIDSNSGEDEIYRDLLGKGIKLEREQISNDYIIAGEDDEVVIERKTTRDYVGSLRDGSLFKQMKTTDLLVIEEDWGEAFRWKNLSWEEINASMASIFIKFKVPILHVDSRNQLIDLFVQIHEQLKPSSSVSYYPPRESKVDDSVRPVFLAKGFAGIGNSTAEKLLQEFGDFKSVVNASVEDLKDVDGIGEAKAKSIYDAVRQKFDK